MAWETRNGIRYYYKKVRENGKVRSIYLGRKDKAEQEEQRIKRKRERKQQWKYIETLQALIHLKNEILLLRAGCHRPNRGEWRKKRTFRKPETAEVLHLDLAKTTNPSTRMAC